MEISYTNYNQEDLLALQKCELSMLKEFDKICKENDIHWVLLFGSAIGAIRHHGFIPWDDDVDVGMMRADYFKLKRIFMTHNNDISSLMLIDAHDDIYYHDKVFPRIYKKGTVFETEKFHNITLDRGETSAPFGSIFSCMIMWIPNL